MKNMLMEAAARCGMELDERSAAQMAEFWAYLKEVNQSMNLTRVDSDAEAAERHFVDSLAPLKAGLIPRGARVLDVGSGAGFPGMPLAIARPDADVTLMDSLGKRVNFLSEAARRAGVRVSAVHARAEEFAAQHREGFDIVTSRAVANLRMLSELCLPLVKVGGFFLSMKSVDSDAELEDAQQAIAILGGRVTDVKDYVIPGTEVTHRLVVVEKISPSPAKYPRAFAKIKKNPL